MRARTKRSLWRPNRSASRSWALDATTVRTPCSVSMRKLPMSALRSRSCITRPSSLFRYRTSAHRLGGSATSPARKSRASR